MELIKFVEKKIGIKFNEMKKYKIFNKKGRNDFERFLISDRVRPFLIMKLLEQYWEDDFYHASEKIYYGSHEKSRTYGMNVLPMKIKGKELFDYYLAQLGIRSLITKPPMIFGQKRLFKRKHEKFEYYSENFENAFFMNENLIIGEDIVYSTKKPTFNLIFDYTKYKNKVPHEDYISFLLKSFPGKISVRSLKASKH